MSSIEGSDGATTNKIDQEESIESKEDSSLKYLDEFRDSLKEAVNDNTTKLSKSCASLLKGLYKELDSLNTNGEIKTIILHKEINHRQEISKKLGKEIQKYNELLKEKTAEKETKKEIKLNRYNELMPINKESPVDNIKKSKDLLIKIESTFTLITQRYDQNVFVKAINKDKINYADALKSLKTITNSEITTEEKLKFILTKTKNDKTILNGILESNDTNSISKLFEIIKQCNFDKNQLQQILVNNENRDAITSIKNKKNIELYINEIMRLNITESDKKDILIKTLFNYEDYMQKVNIAEIFINGEGDAIPVFAAFGKYVVDLSISEKLKNQILILFLTSEKEPNKNMLNKLLEIKNTNGMKMFFKTINLFNLHDSQLYKILNVNFLHTMMNSDQNGDVISFFMNLLSGTKLNPANAYKLFNSVKSDKKPGIATAFANWSINQLNIFFKAIVTFLERNHLETNKIKQYLMEFLFAKDTNGKTAIQVGLEKNSSAVLKNFFALLKQNNYFFLNKSEISDLIFIKNKDASFSINDALEKNSIDAIKIFIDFFDDKDRGITLDKKDVIKFLSLKEHDKKFISYKKHGQEGHYPSHPNIKTDTYNKYVEIIMEMPSLTIDEKTQVLGLDGVNVYLENKK